VFCSNIALRGQITMLRFLVISSRTTPSTVSNAWRSLDILLAGPVAANALSSFDLGGHDGAIVDLDYEGDEMIACVEILDAHQIPFVFAAFVSSSLKPPGCFVLSEAKEDILAIHRRLWEIFRTH
jgi:hypothetical protein